MVRGWGPAVEGELIAVAGATRAHAACADLYQQLSRRLSRPHRAGGRRRRHPAPVRARRMRRTATSGLPASRTTRPASSGSRPIARAGLIPLSARRCRCSRISASACSRKSRPHLTAGRAISTTSWSRCRTRRHRRAARAHRPDRARDRQRPVRRAENDEFNQLVLYAGARYAGGGLAPRLVPLSAPDRKQLRPDHHRRRAAPGARRDARADRRLFTAAHDPVDQQPRQGGRRAPRRLHRRAGQGPVDRRRPHPAPAQRAGRRDRPHQRLFRRRAPRRWRSRSTARWSRAFRAPVPWREIWVYSPAGRGHSPARRARSPAAGFAGPTGATISAPKSSA